MIKIKNVKTIEVSDWDKLVKETYGRDYSFQQQDGCQDRGQFNIKIPDIDNDEEMNDSIPEQVNGEVRGVKFAVWLSRDPKQQLPVPDEQDYCRRIFWDRNFYPDIQTVANDLHKKGLIEAGEYSIDIDW